MTTATQTQDMVILFSKPFYQVICDFYQQDYEIYLGRDQIGSALGYSDPQVAIGKIHDRNAERLDKFSTFTELVKVEGTRKIKRNIIAYNLRGVMEICRFSRQPKADEFMDFVWDVMETLFRGEAVLTPTNNNQLSNIIVEQSLEIGSLKDRLTSIEDAIKKEFQITTREIVRLDGRYHRLNQNQKAIRTALSLHYQEHNPEAYRKTRKELAEMSYTTYFDSMELLFNDMKDTYQSFITNQTVQSENSVPMIVSTLIFRMVEIEKDHLHFQVNKFNKVSMDVFGITKAEKTIKDAHGTAEYRVYCDGCVEPIVFQAVPKRL